MAVPRTARFKESVPANLLIDRISCAHSSFMRPFTRDNPAADQSIFMGYSG
jgi:hypothetical protein